MERKHHRRGKKLRQNEQPNGIATAGLVLSIIAVVFSTIAFFTCGLCVLCVAGAASEANNAINEANNALNEANQALNSLNDLL